MRYLKVADFATHVLSRQNRGLAVAGLDIGKELVGMAVLDGDSKHFVTPAGRLTRKHPRNAPSSVRALANGLRGQFQRDGGVCGVVVGLPLGRDDGQLTPLANEIIQLFHRMSAYEDIWSGGMEETIATSSGDSTSNDIAYTFWDERYSTQEARRLVSSRSGGRRRHYARDKDRVAAAFILEGFREHVLQPVTEWPE